MLKKYLDDGTIGKVGIILASVLIFNSLPKLAFFGKYVEKYPLITLFIGVGIIILIFKGNKGK